MTEAENRERSPRLSPEECWNSVQLTGSGEVHNSEFVDCPMSLGAQHFLSTFTMLALVVGGCSDPEEPPESGIALRLSIGPNQVLITERAQVHEDRSQASSVIGSLLEGEIVRTRARTIERFSREDTDEPVEEDHHLKRTGCGHSWWQLSDGGWVFGEHLLSYVEHADGCWSAARLVNRALAPPTSAWCAQRDELCHRETFLVVTRDEGSSSRTRIATPSGHSRQERIYRTSLFDLVGDQTPELLVVRDYSEAEGSGSGTEALVISLPELETVWEASILDRDYTRLPSLVREIQYDHGRINAAEYDLQGDSWTLRRRRWREADGVLQESTAEQSRPIGEPTGLVGSIIVSAERQSLGESDLFRQAGMYESGYEDDALVREEEAACRECFVIDGYVTRPEQP